jgi:hypothetical protein
MKRGLLLSTLLLASCTISQQQQHNRAMEESIRFNTAHIDKLRAEKNRTEQNTFLGVPEADCACHQGRMGA